jgi:hypothetical protein
VTRLHPHIEVCAVCSTWVNVLLANCVGVWVRASPRVVTIPPATVLASCFVLQCLC